MEPLRTARFGDPPPDRCRSCSALGRYRHGVDRRATELAGLAVGLASGAGIDLPDSLALWRLGGRPSAPAIPSRDPALALGEALEAALTSGERRRGAHYTPAAVADRVAALGLDGAGTRPTVVDPACGGGAMMLAAGRHLAGSGLAPADVAGDLLWGADLDPLAAAVTEAAIALWSGGVAPHVVVADTLNTMPWSQNFDLVIGNPPFQGQLARSTARSATATDALRARFGDAVSPYVDTAALFLLVGVELARDGGRVALVQPLSTIGSRDAGGVRRVLAEQARLVDLWAPEGRLFDAIVHVCVPVLETSSTGEADWAGRLASARGVPAVELMTSQTVADLADVVAGFRSEYYELVGHVREALGEPTAPLVTCGLIGLGASTWGTTSARFAKQRWQRPDVDVDAVRPNSARMDRWLDRVQRPKVVVASQTRVIEAAPDHGGTWVPSTPAISVVPHDKTDVARLTAALCAPPVAAWALRRAVGTGLSPDAIRVSAPLLSDVPLPSDDGAWATATSLLVAGDVDRYGVVATEMYGVSMAVERWWADRRPR